MRRFVSIPFIAGQWSLRRSGGDAGGRHCAGVSIPFIAGQWSLLYAHGYAFGYPFMFQSPSLRGSGRFARRNAPVPIDDDEFQSPSLRGSGRFSRPGRRPPATSMRFNPLHCGAVVASVAISEPVMAAMGMFQSPSLRGSGRFQALLAAEADDGEVMFQSPSLRGSGRFRMSTSCSPRR